MFNYAFAKYCVSKVVCAGDVLGDIAVSGGKMARVAYGTDADVNMLIKTGEEIAPPVINLPQKVKAPVQRGDIIGSAEYSTPTGEKVEVNLIALESVEKASFFDYLKKVFI